MNYVTKPFLLVSSSVRSNTTIVFVKAKIANKNIQRAKTFVGFHNHSSVLTAMVILFTELHKFVTLLSRARSKSLYFPGISYNGVLAEVLSSV